MKERFEAMMGRKLKSGLLVAVSGIAAVGCMTVVQGCGGPAHKYNATVAGSVTVDGELAKSGTVTFHPVAKGQAAIGRIHSDGSYSLRTGQGDLAQTDGGTVASGEYVVTASVTGASPAGEVVSEGGPPKPGPSLIDKKYGQKDTTDLRFTVKPGQQVIVLELKGAEEGAAAETSTADPTPPLAEEPSAEKSEKAEFKTEAKEKSESPDAPETAAPTDKNSTAEPEK